MPLTALVASLAVGISASVGLGEVEGVLLRAAISADRAEASVQVDSSDKYTGAGYALGARLDTVPLAGDHAGLLAGMDYRHRSGGAWAKDTLWLRVGVIWTGAQQSVALVASVPIAQSAGGCDPVMVGVETRRFVTRRVFVRGEGGLVRYVQRGAQIGGYATLSLGIGG